MVLRRQLAVVVLRQDFEETLQLIRDYKFPSLFINQFFARPGTPAAKMAKIPTQEVVGSNLSLFTSEIVLLLLHDWCMIMIDLLELPLAV